MDIANFRKQKSSLTSSTALKGEDLLVADPGIKEEAASSAVVTVVMNSHNEVILLHKSGGLGVSLSQVAILSVELILHSHTQSLCLREFTFCQFQYIILVKYKSLVWC